MSWRLGSVFGSFLILGFFLSSSTSGVPRPKDDHEQKKATKNRFVKEQEVEAGTLKGIQKFTGRPEDYLKSRYQTGQGSVPLKKWDNKTLAQSIADVKDSKGDPKKDVEKEKPIAKFALEMASVLDKQSWKEGRDWVWDKVKTLEEKDVKEELTSDENQQLLLWQRMKWLMQVDCKSGSQGCKAPEKEEAQAFLAALKDAIKDRDDTEKTIAELKKQAAEGNTGAKAKLRGDPSKDSNDPANKYAIMGPDFNNKAKQDIAKGNLAELKKDVEALSWKNNAKEHVLYANTPKGDTVAVKFPPDLTPGSLKAFETMPKDWVFTSDEPEGNPRQFAVSNDGKMQELPPANASQVKGPGGGPIGAKAKDQQGVKDGQAGVAKGSKRSGAEIYTGSSTSCTKCHAQKPKEKELVAVQGGSMPPGGNLSAEEKADLIDYIKKR